MRQKSIEKKNLKKNGGTQFSARKFLKKKIRFGINFDTDNTLIFLRNTVTNGRTSTFP